MLSYPASLIGGPQAVQPDNLLVRESVRKGSRYTGVVYLWLIHRIVAFLDL